MGRSRTAQQGLSERRLFAPDLGSCDRELILSAEAAKHVQVLRLSVGDEVELFDGQGRSRTARLVAMSRQGLRCQPEAEVRTAARGSYVVLVQCLPKGTKLDEIVRMTTELGVAEIRLAVSSRCVSRADEEGSFGKIERLARVAVEAARQSEQPFVPTISPPRALSAVLEAAPAAATKLALVERHGAGVPYVIAPVPLWVVVGPEGGLSVEDLALLRAHSFLSIGLGRSILRTETAAVVGVALALDRLRQRC